MTFIFVERKTREMRVLEYPTLIHEALMAFAEEHPNAEYIVRGRMEGNYILKVTK